MRTKRTCADAAIAFAANPRERVADDSAMQPLSPAAVTQPRHVAIPPLLTFRANHSKARPVVGEALCLSCQSTVYSPKQPQTQEDQMQDSSDSDQNSNVDTEFCRQEFSELRQEIIINTEEKRRLERFCLIGAAVVFSWVATEAPKSGPDSNLYFAAFVPSVLVGFGWLKSTALESTICKIGKYIYTLEERLSPEGEGWEHYYGNQRKNPAVSPEGISAYFWPLLMISTLVGAVILNADSKIGDWLVGS